MSIWHDVQGRLEALGFPCPITGTPTEETAEQMVAALWCLGVLREQAIADHAKVPLDDQV